MINRKVKRVFASLLAAGMLFGCVLASAESETGNDMEMMQGGFGGGRGPMGRGNGNMGGQTQTDPALQAIDDVLPVRICFTDAVFLAIGIEQPDAVPLLRRLFFFVRQDCIRRPRDDRHHGDVQMFAEHLCEAFDQIAVGRDPFLRP